MTNAHSQSGAHYLLRLGLRRVRLIVIASLLSCAIGYVGSAFLTRVYRSEAVVLPISSDDARPGLSMAGQLSSLAALAGLGFGNGEQRNESFEFLQSRALARKFIADWNLMQVFYASRWDAAAGKWKKHWWRPEPSLNDAVKLFSKSIFHLHEDKRTGILRLSIEWEDRQQAAEWANALVRIANSELRGRTIQQSQSSLEFLNQEIKGTEVVELRLALFRLIEEQTKRVMLAKTREDYAFRIIDPAVVPDVDDAVRPNRVALGIAAGLLAGLLSFAGVIVLERRGHG